MQQLYEFLSTPRNGGPDSVSLQADHRSPPPFTKVGDVETYPGLTTHTPVIWIYDLGKEEFYSDKIFTKKYNVGIIDMIKLRNIYNTYTYIPIYIQLNTHIYM